MTWRSITQEELQVCTKMVIWMEIARKWAYAADWLPTQADICKSALFERLMNGKSPLPFPPPKCMSCPWYAVVEDPGPHPVGYPNRCWNDLSISFNGAPAPADRIKLIHEALGERMTGHADPNSCDDATGLTMKPRDGSEQSVYFIQTIWPIVERRSPISYIVRDGSHDTPYRFHLWWDNDWRTPSVRPRLDFHGAWLLRNVEFEKEGQ